VEANLTTRVQATVDVLQTGPADAALIGLALVLARSIDEMDETTRGKMLGQVSGAMLHVLQELRLHAPAPPKETWTAQHPRWAAQPALAARRR
jgi:hypothetical protein